MKEAIVFSKTFLQQIESYEYDSIIDVMKDKNDRDFSLPIG